ncbi:MAG: 1,4-alpha-glucan branching enzyme GlgB [Candidatus Scalindua arabica]|uniref:1,4-alpha-glucan branching enzyme GlgB n=1 Tax=Candidatus Scalindua arabica TaxID=1127984 RepID=A0A942A1H3_9BACT|nr:1,4-alpha-glucan branching enzyme GlgB [Candidatus Scalindua arabica]
MNDRENLIEGVIHNVNFITDHDIYLFKEGNHHRLYDKFGAHIMITGKESGAVFALWAPNAENVSVTGDFNEWNKNSHLLKAREDGSGVWEGFIPGIKNGDIYKYHIHSRYSNYKADKGDPFASYWEQPPKTASVVWDLDYEWNDSEWMTNRHKHNSLNAPFSVYEVHPGSWRRTLEDGNKFLAYREMAHYLADYVKEMGFTHVELLPITEHPFYGSWGYQTVGYFAPTSRYGTPQDFMYLVDHLHQNGIGVILDWVPSHFPSDEHGLAFFDGTYLYEHADPKRGFHPEWNSYIFNYSRNEVRAFLISSALFWLDKYHIDAIRVDAVASMLYLDYARKEGEWIPNKYGGREDLDAISFIRDLNKAVYVSHPDVQTIAEESTAWPMVSKPTDIGGLGFGMKWNMGWMHDTLKYFSKDPVYRKSHHGELTFSIWYAFTENFLLPLSHDEVVHGKGSLIGKMPGDEWQRYANLRLLFGYMYGHPGKKLLFMGGEFAQWKEWNHDESLEWHVLQYPFHQGMQKWVKDLNHLYRTESAIYSLDFSADGFEWIDSNDWEHSIISFIRKDKDTDKIILIVCNFTPVPRHNYKVGVLQEGFWREILNSDAEIYGGSGCGNSRGVEASAKPVHGRKHSISLTLPPLSVLFFKNSD